MMVFSLDFIERVVNHLRGTFATNPLVSALLALIGAAMMLFGSGEWGRWAYLSVFLSIPALFALMTALPQRISDRIGSPAFLVAILGLTAWMAYLLSRRYSGFALYALERKISAERGCAASHPSRKCYAKLPERHAPPTQARDPRCRRHRRHLHRLRLDASAAACAC